MRVRLVGLIVLATIGFVIGTSIERHNSTRESAAQLRAEGVASHAEASGESAATHAAETAAGSTTTEAHKELRPLGVNIEAVPFVVLAALASLALAALGYAQPRWLLGLATIAALASLALAALGYARPRWLLGLTTIAGAMALFGALDVREAFHQSDENQTGLVILAAVIAVLHFASAGVAVSLAARRSAPDTPGVAGTIPV